MGLERLSSRAIIGEYYKTLALGPIGWVNDISNQFESNQASEKYPWLGQVPAFREWIGGRQGKGLRDNELEIENKHFEATLELLVRDLRRDKSGQAMVRIRELARRTNSHWASLLTTDIINGESTVCYDGQFFFDTDHVEGDSGTQSNDISVDISALPTSVHGSTTAPSVEEMQLAIVQTVQQIMSFKDDQGEPFNEDASSFLVMVPMPFYHSAHAAVSLQGDARAFASQTGLDAIQQRGVQLQVIANTRLTWTTKFATFRTDSEIKPLIRQSETDPMFKAVAEGSEYEFQNDAHLYGVDAWRSTGYGLWQHACLATLT